MTAGALSVANLTIERGGRTVVHDASLDIDRGEVAALLGANGAGKSSLVMTIAGVLPARSGSVMLEGRQLNGLKPHVVRRLGVAIVQEGHPVLTNLTLLDNLRAAGLMLSRPESEQEIARVLELFPELRERLTVAAQDLSGGQKQMVNIAQALISRPRFLLIDELSFGLAPAVVVRLGEAIREIAARGVGVLLIEQFTTLALSLTTRAYVMERGNIVFKGTSAELKEKPEILHGAYLAAGTGHS